MKNSVSIPLLASALLISGCSHLPFAHKTDYTSAKPGAELEIPPDLTKPAENDRYGIPEGGGSATLSTYQQAQTTRAVLPEIKSAKIEREGTERWLVVQGTPEELWPRIKSFWTDMGYTLKIDDPKAGIMETEWKESQGLRNKYRTRLERDGTDTDIYVSQRGMTGTTGHALIGSGKTEWQPSAPNIELETEMLSKLMLNFGATQASPVESAPTHARLSSQDNDITLDIPVDRAWRQVGLALDRVGFTVEDQDREKGIYFVNYQNPKEADAEEGILSKIEFWKDKKQATPQKYRIQVKASGAGSAVTVLDKEGFSEHTETSAKILRLLFEQLK